MSQTPISSAPEGGASKLSQSSLLPALVLFGTFAVLTAALLGGVPRREVVPTPTQPAAAVTEPTEAPTEIAALPTEAAAVAYDPALVEQGQALYVSTCSACHARDARGVPGLGKDLIASEFVHGLTDEELLQFIIVGRQPWDPGNTTGIAMPGRGGNPAITDDQLRAIIAWLRTTTAEQTAGGAASAPAAQAAAPTPIPAEPRPTATPIYTGELVLPERPFDAATAYAWSCAGCHGLDGQGAGAFGPGIWSSALFADDDALFNFLQQGRPLANPEVEYPHPPRGGYPELTDEQLRLLIEYLRSIQP